MLSASNGYTPQCIGQGIRARALDLELEVWGCRPARQPLTSLLSLGSSLVVSVAVHPLCFGPLVQGSSSFLGMRFRLNSKESDASG